MVLEVGQGKEGRSTQVLISKLVNGTLLLELFVEQRTIPFSSTDLIWEDTILAMEMEKS